MSSRSVALGLGVLSLLCVPAATAQQTSTNRYPFDPACAWGRLADGRGMIVRCLTEAESTQLAMAKGAPIGSPAAPKPASSAAATAGVSAETIDKKIAPEGYAGPFEADVIAVTADEGKLPAARRKLRAAREKYARCVSDNGGLASEAGEVAVRFLVRELGRAEGTSVEKRQGVSEAAAKCIASVVDRRPVGTPEAPVVGATAVVRVTKQARRRTESATGH